MTCSPKLATLANVQDFANVLTEATASVQTVHFFMEKNKKSINKALTAELNVMPARHFSKTNLASHVKQCTQ